MADLKHVTYCGLHCELCSSRGRLPIQATKLKETMNLDGWHLWGKYVYKDFDQFWNVLSNLTEPDKCCPGCRQGGGDPECKIRTCAKEKNVDVCPMCDDFPCELINNFAKIYPLVIPDGKRMAEIGIEKWIDEQKIRAEKGFIYADIRCSPDANDK